MSNNSEAISPTAHYTGQVWVRNGLSHPVFDTRKGRVLYQALRPILAAYGIAGGPTLESVLLARHQLIDHFLETAIDEGRVTQVIEIAAGFSARGWRFKKKYADQISYIETDLVDMAEHKRSLLEEIGTASESHQVLEMDALLDDGPSSLKAIAEGLDQTQGIAIITEGLLNYFDEAAVRGMWRRFARVMQTFREGQYLSDLHLSAENQGQAISAFGKLLSAYVKGRIHMHFASTLEAETALAEAGFDQQYLHSPIDFLDLLDMDDDPATRLVRVVDARVGG